MSPETIISANLKEILKKFMAFKKTKNYGLNIMMLNCKSLPNIHSLRSKDDEHLMIIDRKTQNLYRLEKFEKEEDHEDEEDDKNDCDICESNIIFKDLKLEVDLSVV
jgi:hypothetical protein